jgi:MFS family permease
MYLLNVNNKSNFKIKYKNNYFMNAVQKTLKDNAAMRWFVLILISAIMFATYWSQDFFSGLKGLMETTMDINSDEFGRLLGFTTIANMFGMIIVGGIVLDKWGIKLAMIVFGALAVLGTFITYLGSAGFFGDDPSTKMVVMVIGRIMFGSGLEVVCVIVTRTVIKWFKGYELALALAINMGFGRLGSALGTSLSIDIAQGSVPTAIGFASSLVGV